MTSRMISVFKMSIKENYHFFEAFSCEDSAQVLEIYKLEQYIAWNNPSLLMLNINNIS